MFDIKNDSFTIGIGGAAGEGVKGTGIKIGKLLQEKGLYIYLSMDYPSLIKGGHNFVRITAGKEKIWSDYPKLDILVALNEETKELHKNELNEGAWVLSGLGIEEIFKKVEEFLNSKNPGVTAGNSRVQSELIDGNSAFAEGLLAAGLDFYFAYPMTPTTSILHYLAGSAESANKKLKVIQPENEISVINMALGAAYAGKKAAIGSASGGFALMQEAFSFAGMAELPIAIAVSQRQAPATGAPTYSSQSDLRFVVHAGHGEFPRVVIAPGDAEESFRAGALALNLAWKFRIPAIVLLDKILSEHLATVESEKLKKEKIEKFENQKEIPGMPGKTVRATSYEHDEAGITIDSAEGIKRAAEMRAEKERMIESEMNSGEPVKIYGDQNSDTTIVFWGSTKGPILEAAKHLNKPAKLLQIIWMEPFPKEKVLSGLNGSKKIICVEANHNGQLASLIREKTGIEITDKILKYDSRPFDPEELAKDINKT